MVRSGHYDGCGAGGKERAREISRRATSLAGRASDGPLVSARAPSLARPANIATVADTLHAFAPRSILTLGSPALQLQCSSASWRWEYEIGNAHRGVWRGDRSADH